MKILVTGANGMFGEAVRKVFKDDELHLTDIFTMDIRKVPISLEEFPFAPEYILHLAAETDLELCEMRPDHAYFTNTIGTFNMVRLAKIFNIPIVYMSTAGVFDGKYMRHYTEDDKPNPINVYGRSKYYGELAVQQYPKHYIFRMSWAMGGGPKLDKKFVNKIYQQIMAGIRPIYGIKDLLGSPTYTIDVARTIRKHLAAKTDYGIYHVAGRGQASRYDVAKAIVEIMRKTIAVIPVKKTYFSQSYPCPRANNEVLISVKPEQSLSCMRDWRESLEEYLRGYYI